MVQYPDKIVITVTTPATQGTDLTWTAGTSANYTFDCRVETNNSGRKIPGADGEMVDYSFAFYMPATSVVIPDGSDYILTSQSNGVIKGKIKKAFNGQLNSRLWG